jgi:hypothetical protein
MARGLPFVYGYKDPDFGADCSFALKVPNTADPINISELIEFTKRISAKPGLDREIRGFAETQLDWSTKTRQAYDFACSVLPRVQACV